MFIIINEYMKVADFRPLGRQRGVYLGSSLKLMISNQIGASLSGRHSKLTDPY